MNVGVSDTFPLLDNCVGYFYSLQCQLLSVFGSVTTMKALFVVEPNDLLVMQLCRSNRYFTLGHTLSKSKHGHGRSWRVEDNISCVKIFVLSSIFLFLVCHDVIRNSN